MNIKKSDIGEKIRSNLVCPLVALNILKELSYKKTPKKIIKFVELAKKDITLIVDLSWKVSQGPRWRKSIPRTEIFHKKIKKRAEKLRKLAKKLDLFGG